VYKFDQVHLTVIKVTKFCYYYKISFNNNSNDSVIYQYLDTICLGSSNCILPVKYLPQQFLTFFLGDPCPNME